MYNKHDMSPQKISKKLKEARLKFGLRQTDVSVNYYARIERDEENPTIETLREILKVLKVKSSDILSF